MGGETETQYCWPFCACNTKLPCASPLPTDEKMRSLGCAGADGSRLVSIRRASATPCPLDEAALPVMVAPPAILKAVLLIWAGVRLWKS